jgi:hypothetical protein
VGSDAKQGNNEDVVQPLPGKRRMVMQASTSGRSGWSCLSTLMAFPILVRNGLVEPPGLRMSYRYSMLRPYHGATLFSLFYRRPC